MYQVKLSEVGKGEFIKRTSNAKKVYVKGDYVREGGWNRYSLQEFEDWNHEIFLKGSTLVYVGFTY